MLGYSRTLDIKERRVAIIFGLRHRRDPLEPRLAPTQLLGSFTQERYHANERFGFPRFSPLFDYDLFSGSLGSRNESTDCRVLENGKKGL